MKYDVVGYAKAFGTDLQTAGGLLRKYRNAIGPAAIVGYLLPHEVLDPNPNWYSTIGRNITMLTAVGLFFGASIGIPQLYKNYFPSDDEKKDESSPAPSDPNAGVGAYASPSAQVKKVIPNPLIPPRTNNPQQYIPKNDLFPICVPI
jgi:hypothetical protein